MAKCPITEKIKKLPVKYQRVFQENLGETVSNPTGDPEAALAAVKRFIEHEMQKDLEKAEKTLGPGGSNQVKEEAARLSEEEKSFTPEEVVTKRITNLLNKVKRTRERQEDPNLLYGMDSVEYRKHLQEVLSRAGRVPPMPGYEKQHNTDVQILLEAAEAPGKIKRGIREANAYSRINNNYFRHLSEGEAKKVLAEFDSLVQEQGETQDTARTLHEVVESLLNQASEDSKENTARQKALEAVLARVKQGYDSGETSPEIAPDVLEIAFKHFMEHNADPESIFLRGKLTSHILRQFSKDEDKMGPHVSDNFTANTTYKAIDEIMHPRPGTPRSLLAIIPNLLEMLRVPRLAKYFAKAVGLEREDLNGLHTFAGFRDEFQKVLEEQVIPALWPEKPEANKTNSGTLVRGKGEYVGEQLEKAPLHLMRSAYDGRRGALPSNIITAMASEFLNWYGTLGPNTKFNDDFQIGRILGISSDQVTKEQRGVLATKGTARRNVIENLSSSIARTLHMQVGEEVNGLMVEKVTTSLAIAALEAGYRMNLFADKGTTVLSKEWFLRQKGRKLSEAELKDKSKIKNIPFVRIATKNMKKGIFEITDQAQKAVDHFKDARGFLQKVFDMQEHARPVLDEPNPEVDRKIPGSVLKTSEPQARAIKHLESLPVTVNTAARDLLSRFKKEDFLKSIMGVKPLEDVHVTEEDSQAGKNLSAVNAYDALQVELGKRQEDGSPRNFFFKFGTKINNRIMIENNDINYEAYLLHRWALTIAKTENTEGWETTFGATEGEQDKYLRNQFIGAIALALDIKLDGLGFDKSVESDEYFARVERLLEEDADINEAVRLLQRAGSKFSTEEADLLGSVAPEGMHSLMGLEAWARYQTFKADRSPNKTFTHKMGIEVDGVTNGLALGFMLIPGSLGPEMQQMLNRVGIYFRWQDHQSLGDYNADGQQMDNYEAIGFKADEVLVDMSNKEASVEGVNDVLTSEQPWRAKQIIERFMALPYLQPLMAEIRDASGRVTKAGRSLFKGPVTQAMYSAGSNSIQRHMAGLSVENFYGGLMELLRKEENDNYTNSQKLEDIVNLMQTARSAAQRFNSIEGRKKVAEIFGPQALKQLPTSGVLEKDFPIPTVRELRQIENLNEYIRNWRMPEKAEDTIRSRTRSTYGLATTQAIGEILGTQRMVVGSINNMFTMMNMVYEKMFAQNVEAKKKELKKDDLSPRDRKDIEIEMASRGWLPSAPHATSYGNLDQQVQITNTDTLIDNEDDRINNRVQLHFATKTPGKGGAASMTQTILDEMPNADIGVKGFVLMIQAMDSNVISRVFAKHEIFHIFDAYVAGTAKADEVGVAINQALYDLASEYNLIEEVGKRAEPFFEKMMSDSFTNEEELVDFTFEERKGNRVIKEVVKIPQMEAWARTLTHELSGKKGPRNYAAAREVVQAVFNGFKNAEKAVSVNRSVLLRSIGAVNQYSKHNAPFRPNRTAAINTVEEMEAASVDLEALRELDSPENSNKSEAHARSAFTTSTSNLLATDVANIFRDLEQADNQEISDWHKNRLETLIQQLLPGIAQIDGLHLNLQINDSDLNTGFNRDNEVYVGATLSQLTSPMDLSLRETYMHELVHAVLRDFIDNDYWARSQLEKLYEQARNSPLISAYSFLPLEEEDTEAELARAQERYDYIFNNPNSANLHEFASLGLTNEPFMRALSQLEPIKLSLREKSKNVVTHPLQALGKLFMDAIEWIASLVDGTGQVKSKGNNAQEVLQNLAQNISKINRQNHGRVATAFETKALKQATKVGNAALAKAWSAWNWLLVKAGHSGGTLDPEIQRAQIQDGHLGAAVSLVGSEFVKLMKQDLSVKQKTLSETGSQLVQEIKGLSLSDQASWRTLTRLSKQIVDTPRKKITDSVTEMVMESFADGAKFSKKQWRAINDVFLRTDLNVLDGVLNQRQLLEILRDPAALSQHINDIEDKLGVYNLNGNAYINQARGLGSLISRGMVMEDVGNQMTNAHDIAHMRFREDPKPHPGSLDRAEKLIDQLATLYAVKFTDSVQRRRAAEIFEKEMSRDVPMNGVQSVMSFQKAFKEESLEKLFNGNKIGTWKGYTKENFDSSRRVEVAEAGARKQMAARGFVPVSDFPLPKDPMDPNRQDMYLYVSDVGLARWRGAIVSLEGLGHKGQDILTTLQESAGLSSRRRFNQAMKTLRTANDRKAARLFQNPGVANQIGKPTLVPILSQTTGKIVNYRYMMSTENKDKLLKRDDQAHQVLGKMYGSIPSKVGTTEINNSVVRQAIADFKEMGRDLNTEFVTLSPFSTNKEHRDIWRMLPKGMQLEASKAFGKKQLVLRKDMFNYILGFREITVTDTMLKYGFKKGRKVPHAVVIAVHAADKAWREVIQNLRLKTSLLLPTVVFDNMLSNVLLLFADGIPPSYVMKKTYEGIHAMRKYQKTERELLKLRQNQLVGNTLPNLDRRIDYLQKQLELSPVHGLIKEGLFQTIVEDVSAASFQEGRSSYADIVSERLDDFVRGNSVAEGITHAVKEGLVLKGSQTFATIMAANQYGDFIGRYIKYRYDVEHRKTPKIQAINDSLDYFIYYDEPTSKVMHAANDYGFLMFSRFFLRSQRVVAKLLRDRFATTALVGLANHYLIGADFLWEYFLDPEKLGNRFKMAIFDPVESVMGATNPVLPAWADALSLGVLGLDE